MRLGRFIALSVLLLTVAFGLFLAVWPPEPSYNGRPLSKWLDDLTVNRSEARSQAADAVRQIGPKAVPFLIPRLKREEDPPWKIKLIGLVSRQSVLKVHFVPASARRFQAVLACDALGPAAKDALPTLEKMFYGNPHYLDAAFIMADIGPEAIPSLTKGLTNELSGIRSYSRTGLEVARNSEHSLPDEKTPDFIERLIAFRLKAAPEIDIQGPLNRR
jgi:hypothetical protein